jgi:hypothetical protein
MQHHQEKIASDADIAYIVRHFEAGELAGDHGDITVPNSAPEEKHRDG